MGHFAALLLFLTVIALLEYTQVSSHALTTSECSSPSDCGPGECCVLGMMRYSMAQCMPLGQAEDYCRDDNEPENRTLHYPGGAPVLATLIHTHVCPCDDGLVCADSFCAPDDSYDTNYLY